MQNFTLWTYIPFLYETTLRHTFEVHHGRYPCYMWLHHQVVWFGRYFSAPIHLGRPCVCSDEVGKFPPLLEKYSRLTEIGTLSHFLHSVSPVHAMHVARLQNRATMSFIAIQICITPKVCFGANEFQIKKVFLQTQFSPFYCLFNGCSPFMCKYKLDTMYVRCLELTTFKIGVTTDFSNINIVCASNLKIMFFKPDGPEIPSETSFSDCFAAFLMRRSVSILKFWSLSDKVRWRLKWGEFMSLFCCEICLYRSIENPSRKITCHLKSLLFDRFQ